MHFSDRLFGSPLAQALKEECSNQAFASNHLNWWLIRLSHVWTCTVHERYLRVRDLPSATIDKLPRIWSRSSASNEHIRGASQSLQHSFGPSMVSSVSDSCQNTSSAITQLLHRSDSPSPPAFYDKELCPRGCKRMRDSGCNIYISYNTARIEWYTFKSIMLALIRFDWRRGDCVMSNRDQSLHIPFTFSKNIATLSWNTIRTTIAKICLGL